MFTAMLLEAKLQWEEDGTVEHFNGFMLSVDFLSIHFLQLQKFIMGTRMPSLLGYICINHFLIPINYNYPLAIIYIDRRL